MKVVDLGIIRISSMIGYRPSSVGTAEWIRSAPRIDSGVALCEGSLPGKPLFIPL